MGDFAFLVSFFLLAIIYLQSYHAISCPLGSGSDGSRQSFCLLWCGAECLARSSQSLSMGCLSLLRPLGRGYPVVTEQLCTGGAAGAEEAFGGI